MLDILRELRLLLSLHGHRGQENVVAQLIELWQFDRDGFFKLVKSAEVWGGAGAVWEVGDLGSDTVPFRYAIIRLAEAMEREQLGSNRSREIADIFRDWNKRGV
ncbi:MAG: hypothetical protein GXX96_09600 [Planctomycetaceae bacterium]|jgi:hypothetical protein|nr:hypothetical protein [Planctomycetaceae bacterium]